VWYLCNDWPAASHWGSHSDSFLDFAGIRNNLASHESKRLMRAVWILLIFSLVGCADQMTIEQLEDEAITTGDWSEVEDYERLLQEQSRESVPECPDGQIVRCVESGLNVKCDCVSVRALSRRMGGGS